MKSLVITMALSAAMLGTAFAQTTPAPSSTPTTPQNSQNTMMPQNSQNSTMPQSSSTSSTSSPSFVNAQGSDQWLASRFKGTDVVGPQDEKIGDVSDVLFDREGKVIAYIVGVGGFLGIGAKDVALAPTSFSMVPGQSTNDYKLRLSMTKEQLQNAVAFEPRKSESTTTGAGTPTGSRPASAPANTAK